jgi:hypothetical protein
VACNFLHCCASSVPSRRIDGREEFGLVVLSGMDLIVLMTSLAAKWGAYIWIGPPQKGKGIGCKNGANKIPEEEM